VGGFSVLGISSNSEGKEDCAFLSAKSLGGREFAAAFRGLPVETRLPKLPVETPTLSTSGATKGDLCLLSPVSIPNPAPVPLYLRDFEISIADSGLVFEDVPVWVLPGVEGESPPIRDTRAPDRGVTFPLSFEVVGDRQSSLRDGGAAVDSDLGIRREGLIGDTFFDPASLGVNGLFEGR